jgi:hypothetical protein
MFCCAWAGSASMAAQAMPASTNEPDVFFKGCLLWGVL